MQLHEAVNRFDAFRNYLDAQGLYADEPFQVISMGSYYFIQASALICDAFSLVAHEQRTIELQRGGTRQFKTFEAAANALREIGQDRAVVFL